MRWNCPHCKVALAISDETLGNDWNFSRCFQCGGFGLIRRTEVNLVKIDKAPPGEKVLLSERPDSGLMNREATENLARLRTQIDEQARFDSAAAAVSSPAQKKIPSPPNFFAKAGGTLEKKVTSPLIQKPVGALLLAPQLTEKAEQAPFLAQKAMPFPLPPLADKTRGLRRTQSSAILGLTAIVALVAGLYLLNEGRALIERGRLLASTTPEPLREHSVSTVIRPAQLVDRLPQKAMAPIRTLDAESKSEASAIFIEIQAKNALFRSGPGTEFRSVGIANPGLRYVVSDWKDRWFKVTLPTQAGFKPETAAWIRNDLVRLVAKAEKNPVSISQ